MPEIRGKDHKNPWETPRETKRGEFCGKSRKTFERSETMVLRFLVLSEMTTIKARVSREVEEGGL